MCVYVSMPKVTAKSVSITAAGGNVRGRERPPEETQSIECAHRHGGSVPCMHWRKAGRSQSIDCDETLINSERDDRQRVRSRQHNKCREERQ